MSKAQTIRNLPEMVSSDTITLKEILSNLLDKKDLELKTEIHNPRFLTILKMISIQLEIRKYPLSFQVLDKYIYWFLIYMVSYKRESRKEIIHALSYLLEKEKELSFGSKLTTDTRK